MMLRLPQRAPLLFLAPLLLAATAACEEPPATRNPLLPPGFAETPVPQVPLSAYLYINQGSPIAFSTAHFQSDGSVPEELLSSLPDKVELDTLRLWSQPHLNSYGALFGFSSDTEAHAIGQLLDATQERLPDGWHQQEEDRLLLLKGTDPWGESLKSAVQQGQMVPVQEAYPTVWEVLQALPENPPAPAIAVGFLRVEEGNIEAMASKLGLETRGLSSALGFIRLEAIALALYSSAPLEIEEAMGVDYLARSQMGMAFAARSGYPGFLVSTILSVIESRSALEEVSLDADTTALYLSLEPLQVLLTNRGNLILGGVAPSREGAEALLRSALEGGW